MSRTWCAGVPVLLALCGALLAQNPDSSRVAAKTCDPDSPQHTTPLEVLSHTNGVDFRPYLPTLWETVRQKWYAQIPTKARSPMMTKGCIVIDFTISKDGKLDRAEVTATSQDEELDDAALRAISSSSPFPPLPEGSQQSVKLRFAFYYNPGGSPRGPWIRTDFIYLEGTIPRGLYTPSPAYTAQSSASAENGVVLLSLVVTKQGKAKHVKVLQSLNRELDQAALKTVKTWKFETDNTGWQGCRCTPQCQGNVQLQMNSNPSTALKVE